jgi:predicted alpha-1,2-mannosidase
LSVAIAGQTRDLTHWVDPFIGTGGHGHTYPGATMPFGMVQLSPDTRTDNWDGSSGYHYSDDIIYGFSHTHLSGTGIPDYCDILFMPTVGEPQFAANEGDKTVNGYASKFSHANEHAEPGYYSVKLDDDGILAEMTATKRVGMHRYTFPRSDKANFVLDLKWRDTVLDSKLTVVGKNRVEGYRRSSSWAKDQVIFFAAEFSKDFDSVDYKWITTDDPRHPERTLAEKVSDKAAFNFKTSMGEKISLKVALSPVSIEGARRNLVSELPGWNFEKVRADAKAAWNKELSKIEVSGGTDAQTTTFYTALYHTMIQPNIFQDVDGSYRGLDGKVHNITGKQLNSSDPKSKIQNPKSNNYTVFSLWDTFRAAHPLYTIIDQTRTVDFINTFIRQYEQGGRLPVWELAGNETDCMIGYHAVSVIADAMAKGIRGFDYEKAYAAAKHSAELDHFGLSAYKKRGYISMEDENESVSKTLEYAYDDWCIAQMARVMGRRYEEWLLTVNKQLQSAEPERQYAADYEQYSARARNFENLFDPETGFMRPKKNASFLKPFAPSDVTFNFTEGNSWVYSFFAPHDIIRLMELQGGPKKFAAKLDELFTTKDKLAGRDQPDITGLIGQYAHGNEPSHHIAYLYVYAGEPWKTQALVRRIMDEFYKPIPDGLIGNEDCGQMSAWYVMSALGFYPVTPGDPTYAIGTPLFKEARIRLENGKTFTIQAPGVSAKNKYLRSVNVNGRSLDRAFLSHKDVMDGGVMEFDVTDKPDKDAMAYPLKHGDVLRERDSFVAVPLIDADKRTFRDPIKFGIRSLTRDTRIFFTLDGSEPTDRSRLFDSVVGIVATTNVKAIAINDQGDKSKTVDATFYRMPNDWTVSIDSKYNRQYTGGGDEGLIDGIRGTTNFASGEWQGYQGQDLVATIDLKQETEIKSVGGGFLQNAKSWIWMPTHIEFEVSDDNVTFRKVADIKTDISTNDMEPKVRDYRQAISPVKARYVRIRAFKLGKIPSWHPGAGSDAFIFVDEIFIS